MKRRKLATGLGLTILFLTIACSSLTFSRKDSTEPAPKIVADIPYCDDDTSVLCVISFGVDNKDRTVINFYSPYLPPKNFYLKVIRDESGEIYECQKAKDFPKYVYCAGNRIPLQESIEIEVYLKSDDSLLAHGAFVVMSLAMPTQVVITTTPETPSLTPLPVSRTKTPTATRIAKTQTPTATSTESNSYPTP